LNNNKEDSTEELNGEEKEAKEEKIWELSDIDEEEKSEIFSHAEEEAAFDPSTGEIEKTQKKLSEINDKYVRLYAEFDNYKRVVSKEKEELIKYSHEEILKELLSVIDHLELALQHSADNDASSALAEGVEITLKELKNTLDKFGLISIDAKGKPFDPFFHHAMTQIETDKEKENIVVEEFRKGYMLRDRVIRPAFVGVSKKPANKDEDTGDVKSAKKTDTVHKSKKRK
jgi:molecular chaperone GrpE